MPGKKGAPAKNETLSRQIKVSSTQYIYFNDSWNEEDTINLFNKYYDICLIRILVYDHLIKWISWQIKPLVGFCVVILHFLSPTFRKPQYIHIQHLYPEDGNSMFLQNLHNHLAGYKEPHIRTQTVNLQRRLNVSFHREFRLWRTVLLNSTGSIQSNFDSVRSRYTSWPIPCTYFSNSEVAVSENNCYFLSCHIVQCSNWVQTFKMNFQPLF